MNAVSIKPELNLSPDNYINHFVLLVECTPCTRYSTNCYFDVRASTALYHALSIMYLGLEH